MRVCILGPLELWEDGRELPLGRGRQRELFALLFLHANEVVSTDRLIDALWREDPPATAGKVVQTWVSQLRKMLPEGVLLTRPNGYLLRVTESDASEFEDFAAAARAQEPARAAETLRKALALWRGRPFADVEYETWAQAEIARLDELHLLAFEERIDADLQLGESGRLVPELEALVTEHPLSERLRALLMLALYRAGRQADALAVYVEARRRLVDQLGIEPGPELQEMQRRILAQDNELGARPPNRALAIASRRARWLVVAGVVLIAGAAAGAALLITTAGGHVVANSLTLVRGSGGIASEVGVGLQPSQIAVGAGAVWTLNSTDNTITRVDPTSDKAVATFAAGSSPVAIAASPDALWIGNAGAIAGSAVEGTMLPASLTKLDPVSRAPIRTVALPRSFVSNVLYGRLPGQHELVVGGGSVWVIAQDGHVIRLDVHTGALRGRLSVTADALAFGGGELWIDQAGSQVLRLDPRTNRVDFSYPLPAGPGIAYGFGSAWIADPVQGLLWRLTVGPGVQLRSIPVADGTTAVAASSRAVWASSVFANTVNMIDPRSNRVTETISLTAPQDVAAAADGIWIATGAPPPANGPLPQSSCGPLVYGGPGKPEFIVASDLALHGSSGISTRPMASAVEELIRERGFRAGRYRIGYQSCDDSTTQSGAFDWARCVANARAYGSDLNVIGVVGTYNSACASVEIPILDRAHDGPVALVSPSNTNGGLTISSLYNSSGYVLYPGTIRNYARVIAPEQIQYAADAVLEKRLDATRIAVLDDGDPYAIQTDRWFTYAATRLDLDVVRIPWNAKHPNPGRIVNLVRASRANGIFVAAGGLPTAARTVAVLNARFGKLLPIVVTDWFFPLPLFRQLAHGSLDGVYVSNPGEPNSSLTSTGRRFVSRVGSSVSYTAAYGGAAAEVLLDAIARSNGTRTSVAHALFQTRIRNGILGNLTINSNGDPITAPVTIFRFRTGGQNNIGASDYDGAVVSQVITPPPNTIALHR
jgi:DNA-binding SARP family transcriptional activator/ABC-type branched-subunit amino acid transport system substrate-binding protein